MRAICTLLAVVATNATGLARTPPMGWSSWCVVVAELVGVRTLAISF
jgi:hypothetical protein